MAIVCNACLRWINQAQAVQTVAALLCTGHAEVNALLSIKDVEPLPKPYAQKSLRMLIVSSLSSANSAAEATVH